MMAEVFVRLYGMLNDFLPPEMRGGGALRQRFDVSPSLKALIEGLGVPHTEIELVVVNGQTADLSRAVAAGDRVAVYPPFHSIDIGRARDTGPVRFILDVHLGRLARWLRMLGFDASWSNDNPDEELARMAGSEDRILLTRDRGLLMRNEVRRGYWLRNTDPRLQLTEVTDRYGLLPRALPFTRCLECNATLEAVAKDAVSAPEGVLARNDDFRRCPACRRVFWKGTHYRRMSELIDSLRQRYGNPPGAEDIQ